MFDAYSHSSFAQRIWTFSIGWDDAMFAVGHSRGSRGKACQELYPRSNRASQLLP